MSLNEVLQNATNALNKNADLYFEKNALFDQKLAELEQRTTQKEQQIDAVMAQWGIKENLVLIVGGAGQFGTIQEAWNHIARRQLQGMVTIQVVDGVYEQSSLTLSNQPFAAFIRIIGNVANPENCLLQFTNDANGKNHGILVLNCWGIEISGFKARSTDRDNNIRGIVASQGSYIRSADNSLIIENCKNGIETYMNSVFEGRGVRITDSITALFAMSNSMINVPELVATGPGKDFVSGPLSAGVVGIFARAANVYAFKANLSEFAFGIVADHNGYAFCDGAQASNCRDGFFAAWGGLVWCLKTKDGQVGKASGCENGFRAAHGGILSAMDAHAINCGVGFRAEISATMTVNGSKAKDCTDHAYHVDTMSLLDAWDTEANLEGNAADYNLAHATTGAYGAMIRRS